MTVSPIPVAPEPPEGASVPVARGGGSTPEEPGPSTESVPSTLLRLPKYYTVKRQLLDLIVSHGPGQPGAAGTRAGPRLRHVTDHGPAGPGRTGGGGPRCCAGRARARSWPSRRWRSRSSWPATPKACAQHGLHPQTRILDIGYVAADEELAAAARRPAGRPALRIHRLGWPTASRCRSTPRTCPPAASPACAGSSTGTPRCTRRCALGYGIQLAEAEETIETVLADPHDANLLGVDVGPPAAAAVPARDRRHRAAGGVGAVRGTGATGTSSSPGCGG